jgi:hypothetical protein
MRQGSEVHLNYFTNIDPFCRTGQTWTLHGLAVKGAFALGLHSQQASQQFSPLESEIRKRTWLGCILLDRVLSMTFGRPPSRYLTSLSSLNIANDCTIAGIHEDFIRVSPAQLWSDLSGFTNPELQQSSTEFYNMSVSLHRLIGSAVDRLYGQNLGYDTFSESESIPRVFALEQDLNGWSTSLPPDLPLVWSTALPTSNTYRDRAIGRFRTMLTLRYYNLNTLVHRPLLCKGLDDLSESTFLQTPAFSDMAKHSVDICIASAEETIGILPSARASQRYDISC